MLNWVLLNMHVTTESFESQEQQQWKCGFWTLKAGVAHILQAKHLV